MVGAGVHGRRPAVVRLATTTSAPRRCSPRCTRPASTGWCWPRRWWSTARGATPAPTHGAQHAAAARAVADLDAGRLREPLPGLRPPARLGRSSTRTPGSTRAAATPRARSPRSTTPSAWARQARRRGRRAALPQRLRARDAAGHAVLRRRGDVPLRRSSAARRRGSSRTAARCATSCTSTTSPGPTCWRCDRCAAATRRPSRPTTSAPGRPVAILDVARARWRRTGGPAPVVTGELPARRRAAHRRLAGPRARRDELGLHGARDRGPSSGPGRAFATDPLP